MTSHYVRPPFIRLTKIAECHDPTFASATFEEFRHGEVNAGVSLPRGYWLEGWLLYSPQPGRPVVVWRVNRNGTRAVGLFVSSPVECLLASNRFTTRNSMYTWSRAEPSNNDVANLTSFEKCASIRLPESISAADLVSWKKNYNRSYTKSGS